MSNLFPTQTTPTGLSVLQLAWANEDRLSVSSNAGLQLCDRQGELLAFHPDDFGLHISCPPIGDFVRYIHSDAGDWQRRIRDWHWEKKAVKPVAEIEKIYVSDGKYDRHPARSAGSCNTRYAGSRNKITGDTINSRHDGLARESIQQNLLEPEENLD